MVLHRASYVMVCVCQVNMCVLKTLRVLFMHSVCSHKSFFPSYTSTGSPTIGYNLSWLMKGRTAFPAPCLPCMEEKKMIIIIPALTQLLPHPCIEKVYFPSLSSTLDEKHELTDMSGKLSAFVLPQSRIFGSFFLA